MSSFKWHILNGCIQINLTISSFKWHISDICQNINVEWSIVKTNWCHFNYAIELCNCSFDMQPI